MPESDLQLLIRAAHEAGPIAMRFWRREPKAWEKPGLGPVTEADIAVNEALEATLRGARPDYGWLSEESADDPARLTAETIFVIDPIDGTRAFMAGEDTFSHSLAVVRGGRVMAGVVYLPVLDRLYAAEEGGIATRNGAPIRASEQQGIGGATLLTTRPNLLPEHWPGGVPELKRSFRSSIAFRMCLVAEGRHDGMLALRDSWEWDIAAGDLIARQAGAMVTDRHGGRLAFNLPRPQAAGVLAAAPALHEALLARLRA